MSTRPGRDHDHDHDHDHAPTRRAILKAGGAVVAAARLGWGPATTSRGQEGGESGEPAASFVRKSQALPEPRVILPTDALPPPRGPRRRIAAITTAYFKYSHADDIITKFIEGYAVVGRAHQPHVSVVGMSIEQFPETDIGRGLAARYGIPLFDTPAGALTLGGDELAVDGVLLVGEHGDYPSNAKGQQLYPRRRLFEEIVKVFRRSGRSVPVYNDKHFSYDWRGASWMYGQSRALGFPMMAGSSVPVAWRRPPLAMRPGIALDGALALGFGVLEVYGFHALELLQAFVERRRGGEVGIKAVQCLEGPATWASARAGRWRVDLLRAALGHVPRARHAGEDVPRDLDRADPEAVVFLVEYSDGFRATAYLSRGLAAEFGFAAAVRGLPEPVGTWCELNKPQRDHFSFLCNHIEVMFRTGRPSYPVERTYLVTGALAALIDSRAAGGLRIETPHLAGLGYTPAPELTVS
jgi:hypothetical protein